VLTVKGQFDPSSLRLQYSGGLFISRLGSDFWEWLVPPSILKKKNKNKVYTVMHAQYT
jgi:hypothetical protein